MAKAEERYEFTHTLNDRVYRFSVSSGSPVPEAKEALVFFTHVMDKLLEQAEDKEKEQESPPWPSQSEPSKEP